MKYGYLSAVVLFFGPRKTATIFRLLDHSCNHQPVIMKLVPVEEQELYEPPFH